MKLNMYILLVVFILSITFVSATNWYFPSNSDLNQAGESYDYTAYALNYENRLAYNFTSCNVEGSQNTSNVVMYDVDRDNIEDVVFANSNSIYVYDRSCGQISTFNTNSTVSHIYLTNINTNSYADITVKSADTLTTYEYVNGAWSIISYMDNPVISQLTAFACDYQPYLESSTNYSTYCLGLGYMKNVTVFKAKYNTTTTQISNWSISSAANVTAPYLWGSSNSGQYMTYGSDGTSSDRKFLVCYDSTNSSVNFRQRCAIYNYLGSPLKNWYMPVGDSSLTNMYYWLPFYATVRGLKRIFVSLDYRQTTSGFFDRYNTIYDINGNTILSAGSQTNPNAKLLSNWMVGDHDMVSNGNEACYINATGYLFCYNGGGSLLYSIFMNDMLLNTSYNSKGFIMSDFDNTSTKLGIASDSGIWTYSAGDGEYHKTTNFSFSANNWTESTLVSNPGSLSPFGAAFSNNLGLIWSNPFASVACGDGVCDVLYESQFSCPTDCGFIQNGSCISASDCALPYVNCVANQCVAGSLTPCISDANCELASPICFNHVCISGSAIPLSTTSTNTVSVEQNIKNAINMITGTNSFLKLIVALFIVAFSIIGTYGYLAKMHIGTAPNLFIPLIVGVIALIGTTMVGMMPIYVLIIFILACVSLWLLFAFILKPSSGE